MTDEQTRALTLDGIQAFLKGAAFMIGSCGIIIGAYIALGLPVPVSEAYINTRFEKTHDAQVQAENRINDLEVFARATRSIILRQDRRAVQAEIDRYVNLMSKGSGSVLTRRLIQTLREDVRALESQIRKLED